MGTERIIIRGWRRRRNRKLWNSNRIQERACEWVYLWKFDNIFMGKKRMEKSNRETLKKSFFFSWIPRGDNLWRELSIWGLRGYCALTQWQIVHFPHYYAKLCPKSHYCTIINPLTHFPSLVLRIHSSRYAYSIVYFRSISSTTHTELNYEYRKVFPRILDKNRTEKSWKNKTLIAVRNDGGRSRMGFSLIHSPRNSIFLCIHVN